MRLGLISGTAVLAGLACATSFVWALTARLDRYGAPTFIGLMLASAAFAGISHLAGWLSRRRQERPTPRIVRDLRLLLSVFAVAAVLWTAFPSVRRPIAGWVVRQIAAARYLE